MSRPKRRFCAYCGARLTKRLEEDVVRDYCRKCGRYFYDNPLPVVSTIVPEGRSILLVQRGRAPYKGLWCPSTGFAEVGERIEDAALRELEEETGLQGKVTSLVHVDSTRSRFYGDLLFVTFEVERVGGTLRPGSDTVDARYFAVSSLPRLAFPSNKRAIAAYLRGKREFWAIQDSFAATMRETERRIGEGPRVSDRLIMIVEERADEIAEMWLRDVTTNPTTPSFAHAPQHVLRRRILRIISHFGQWLGGFRSDREIQHMFAAIGEERARDGYGLHELISALSLLKKHVWEFALGQGMWQRIVDIYAALELDRRIVVFFDRATFHMVRGYVEAGPAFSSGKD